jgi:arabinan endo-1,5-alpha-L-arabinosidase
MYYLYYSASTFGQNTSVIGLMTNASFDPGNPADGWEDKGLVEASGPTDDFNAIDPFRLNTSDGRAWLTYGSFWDGIRLVELDPKSGMPKVGSEATRLASRGGKGIEAPSILEHAGRFYLFVSFDQCCRGEASTYRIMVGRADKVTGPYLAKDGTPMLEGGATELLATKGRVAGPGGQEPFRAGNEDMLVYHFYDRRQFGMPTLAISPIGWTEDGWPIVLPPD